MTRIRSFLTPQPDSPCSESSPFDQAAVPPPPPSQADNMMKTSRWIPEDLGAQQWLQENTLPSRLGTRAARRQTILSFRRTGGQETSSDIQKKSEPPGKPDVRRMRRSKTTPVMNSLHPLAPPVLPCCGPESSKAGSQTTEAASTSKIPPVCLPDILEQDARVVLKVVPEGRDWRSCCNACLQDEINLLECFVEGQSIHEHLLQGILEALPIDPTELRVASSAEKQSSAGHAGTDTPSPTQQLDTPSPLLVTLFIDRVLSSGVLAELRRRLHSLSSSAPIGLDLGDVCGTAQVVSVEVFAAADAMPKESTPSKSSSCGSSCESGGRLLKKESSDTVLDLPEALVERYDREVMKSEIDQMSSSKDSVLDLPKMLVDQ